MVLLLGWMPSPIRTIEPRHLAPLCVCCGLNLRGAAGDDSCPRCGTDFEARPPRSYAEMEGLMDAEEPPVPLRRPAWRERQLVERWLAFAFVAALVGVVVVGLVLTGPRT